MIMCFILHHAFLLANPQIFTVQLNVIHFYVMCSRTVVAIIHLFGYHHFHKLNKSVIFFNI